MGKYETNVEPKIVLIEEWARDGLTVDQIAENLGISKPTLYRYCEAHTELRDALKKEREVADAHIENKLYKSAFGFYYKEQVMTPSGEIKEIERYSKPNVTAAIFWLKNRRPEKWRDKKELDHTGDLHVQIIDDIEDDVDSLVDLEQDEIRPM